MKQNPVLRHFLVAVLALSACSDEQPRKQAESRSGLEKTTHTDWLTAQDGIDPQTWLIDQAAKSGRQLSQDDVRTLAQSLKAASAKFKDSPRMIANRAVQLEAMLKAEGGAEIATRIIAELTGVIAPGRLENFSEAGQLYYNMRRSGLSDQQALSELSKRYGSRS